LATQRNTEKPLYLQDRTKKTDPTDGGKCHNPKSVADRNETEKSKSWKRAFEAKRGKCRTTGLRVKIP